MSHLLRAGGNTLRYINFSPVFMAKKCSFKSNQDSTRFELNTLSSYLLITLTFSIINRNELTELKLEQPKQHAFGAHLPGHGS